MIEGNEMYKWAEDLFPINRSITGQGVRETLKYLKGIIPNLEIKSLSSGKKVFDWTIPKEWNVKEAYIITPSGDKIADFKKNNLHLMGYSIPVNLTLSLEELQGHLYSLPDQPSAIPYITSYYKENWGFCLTEIERKKLVKGEYRVVINSKLENGVLNYGEILIPGKERKEILLSTYICHPSMANNELSGPVITTKIAQWLLSKKENLRYSYRIVYVPETIGSIAYIHENLAEFKTSIDCGFVITCVGDNNEYSFLKSKWINTPLDGIGENAIKYHSNNNFKTYSFLDRGSDERQYSSVGVDIPIISLMRTKYGEFQEYHTSLDNLDYISAAGLQGSLDLYEKAITLLEEDYIYKVCQPCEPQLGKRGLYPNTSTKKTKHEVATMMNFIAFSDGSKTLVEIANYINADALELISIAAKLEKVNIIKKVST